MKEQLKEFILQKLGGKLPDDPNQDAVKICGIKVFEGYRFDTEFQIIDKYDANSLYVGVGYYSGRPSHVMLSICGNLTDGHGNRVCMRSVALSNSKLDDGIESLVKLMRAGVIQLTGYPASEPRTEGSPESNEKGVKMKERLKEFILKTIGDKLPDDISADVLKSCNIKLIDAQKLLRYADLIVASSERNNLWIGVSYSDHVQSAMLHICSGHNGLQWKPVFLKNLKFGEGLDLLCKLIKEDVIEIPEFQESQCLKFNDEDKVDHQTVALLATCNGKWLLSINLKHHMLTLPIGKVHPNESLLEGLCREMREELGFPDLVYTYGTGNIILKTKFKKIYDFDGTPVNVETFVFHVNSDERYANGIWGVAENREPEKCGGLMWVNRDDIRRIAESTGLMLADCVDAALNADMVRVEHVVQ